MHLYQYNLVAEYRLIVPASSPGIFAVMKQKQDMHQQLVLKLH